MKWINDRKDSTNLKQQGSYLVSTNRLFQHKKSQDSSKNRIAAEQNRYHRGWHLLYGHLINRHAQHHAHKAEEAAEQQDGEQHPEGGQPRGVPQDLGAQDIAVKLLEQ